MRRLCNQELQCRSGEDTHLQHFPNAIACVLHELGRRHVDSDVLGPAVRVTNPFAQMTDLEVVLCATERDANDAQTMDLGCAERIVDVQE